MELGRVSLVLCCDAFFAVPSINLGTPVRNAETFKRAPRGTNSFARVLLAEGINVDVYKPCGNTFALFQFPVALSYSCVFCLDSQYAKCVCYLFC